MWMEGKGGRVSVGVIRTRRLLVATDLTESDGTRLVAVRLLDTTGRRGGLASGCGKKKKKTVSSVKFAVHVAERDQIPPLTRFRTAVTKPTQRCARC
jgi:hypothetical protein